MAAKTYFGDGIPVTNESLTYATMEFQQLEGLFRFIRRRQPTRNCMNALQG